VRNSVLTQTPEKDLLRAGLFLCRKAEKKDERQRILAEMG
jgi:hypothetical protein